MTDIDTQELVQDELRSLKDRADQMGISYHPNISLEKLRDRVNAYLKDEVSDEEEDTPISNVVALKPTKAEIVQEATRLIRVRVTCMNPNKREWAGELFTVGNRTVGTIKKFVPFNVEWHVPNMMLKMIQARQCQIFHNVRDNRGNTSREGKLIKEFNVEILAPLTEKELKELAQRQLMANGEAI